MGEQPKEIAMKLDLGTLFYKHLDRMSETTSKISDIGQVTNFKMEVWLLEAILWDYIVKAKKTNYYEDVAGWAQLKTDRFNLENKLTQKHLGEDGVSSKKNKIDVEESLIKMKGLMGFAVKQGIAPGYKPAEKKLGVVLDK